jgi:Rrf2 family protein
MLKLSRKSDYGLIALKDLAEHSAQGPRCTRDIAQRYHIPVQLLAKILQVLARENLTVSQAGSHGGYHLARPAAEINAFEVIRAIDGPLCITSCMGTHETCALAARCTIKEPLRKVNDSILNLLSSISIADLAELPGRKM